MKNKKLLVTAIATAIVLSMQAMPVFAGEASDADSVEATVPYMDTVEAKSVISVAEAIESVATQGSKKDDNAISKDTLVDIAKDAAKDATAGIDVDAAKDALVDVAKDVSKDTLVDIAKDAAKDATAGIDVDAAKDATAGIDVDAAKDATVGIDVDAAKDVIDGLPFVTSGDVDAVDPNAEPVDPEAVDELIQSFKDNLTEVMQSEDLPLEKIESLQSLLNGWIAQAEEMKNTGITAQDLEDFFASATLEIWKQIIGEDEKSGKCGDNLQWELDTESGVLSITGTGDMYDFDDPYAQENIDDDDDDIADDDDSGEELSDEDKAWYGKWISKLESAYNNEITQEVLEWVAKAIPELEKLQKDEVDEQDFAWINQIIINLGKALKFDIDSVEEISEEEIAEVVIPEEETSEEEVSWLGKLIAKLETKVDSDKINSFISKLIVTGEDADDEDNSEDADDADETAFIAPWYPMYPLIHFVTIDSGVTSIGANAFPNCALGSITIPTSVIRIGDKAFEDCLIEDVYYAGTEEEWKKIQMGVGNSEAFENATMHYLGSKQDEDSDSKSDKMNPM